MEHQTFFAANEGEQRFGKHRFVGWQLCSYGMETQVKIAPSLSLENIVGSIEWLLVVCVSGKGEDADAQGYCSRSEYTELQTFR